MSACAFSDSLANTSPAWRARIIAILVVLGAHLLLVASLLQHRQMQAPPTPAVRHLQTTLITLPRAEPAAVPAAVPHPEPEPLPTPPPPVEPPAVSKPRVTPPKPDKSPLARQQQAHQRQAEHTRRQQEKQRQQQALAQQRVDAEQRRQAAAQAEQHARQAAKTDTHGRQYQPISKQTPDYPEKALKRKIEGSCTVVYRVNRRGEVEDPQAQSDCNPLFVRTSINAAKTFRYQPRVINGQPVDVPQVKNTFHFRIQ